MRKFDSFIESVQRIGLGVLIFLAAVVTPTPSIFITFKAEYRKIATDKVDIMCLESRSGLNISVEMTMMMSGVLRMLGTVALVLGYVESSAPSRATGYVEYLPGTGLNVILSAPHGGVEEPASIPDRDAGCWDGSQCIWSHTCGSKDPDQ